MLKHRFQGERVQGVPSMQERREALNAAMKTPWWGGGGGRGGRPGANLLADPLVCMTSNLGGRSGGGRGGYQHAGLQLNTNVADLSAPELDSSSFISVI